MTDYKLVPVVPTAEMLAAGKYALEFGCYASGIYADMLSAAPHSVKQPTFTVGTDLSDGKLTVVVVKHEGNISWVIHTEVIHLAEQTKPVRSPRTEDTVSINSNSVQEQFSNIDTDTFCDYCGGNDEDPQDHCMDCTRPEQQPVGEMISNDGNIYWTDRHPSMGTKLYTTPQSTPDVTQLVEALKAAQREAVYGLNHARTNLQASAALGRVSAICDAAFIAYQKCVTK